MKRWMCILVLVLLLTGCAQNSPDPTNTTTVTTPIASISTEPSVPEAEPEALRTQNLDREYQALVPMGENLVLIGDGILSLYTPNGVAATAVISLPVSDSGSLRVTQEHIVYYLAEENALVTLNQDLKEASRAVLQEAITGDPWISADGSALYYCTAAGIRVFDGKTGISRNLKVQEGDWLGITGALFDNQFLICQLQQPDGSIRNLLVSAETGETTYEGDALANITASGDFYCCITDAEWIFGYTDQQPQNLLVEGAIALASQQLAYTLTQDEAGLWLNLYDLSTGLRTAAVCFPDGAQLSQPVFWQDNLVVLSGSQLCFWDWTLSPVEDETVYTAVRYTAEDPDVEGLAAFQAQAEALEAQYGIEILLWNDVTAVQPAGYSFAVEHRTRVYEAGFAALEAALARFPDGFFKTAASWTEDGKIHIVLARSITAPAGECGRQYLLDRKVYIPLALDDSLEQTFYHGLGHIIDTLVLNNSGSFDDWRKTNPSGFAYDQNYGSWQNRESKYLIGGNRYFVNSFAMTFPVEDRATLLEYALLPDNAQVFESKYMQAKLKRLKTGLREAFGLKGEAYPWEQYLQ